MKNQFLSIGCVERQLWTGEKESIVFHPGVNLFVGAPNTGKTKWLQMIDYLLGDSNSFESKFEEDITNKYDAGMVELFVGDERTVVERRWKLRGAKTKVFVNGAEMATTDFQHFLLEKLGIPLLHFPKGNPLSGQTWPELSFRMLWRHIYRQQRFWGGLVDQQPDGELHACLLQFLGLAEHVYSDIYGELVNTKLELEHLKARRDQYGLTLNEIARDVLSDPDLRKSVNLSTVRHAKERIATRLSELIEHRQAVINGARDSASSDRDDGQIAALSIERAGLIVTRDELNLLAIKTNERMADMRRYNDELVEELDRLARAEDAGAVLADLKITHCPACDQAVNFTGIDHNHCHLCHQQLVDEPLVDGLGSTRLQFEIERLAGERKEAEELLGVLEREARRVANEHDTAEERLLMVENKLAPARQAVSAFVNAEVSVIDMEMGELNERQRQVSRLEGALELRQTLEDRIKELERKIVPIQSELDKAQRAANFGDAEELLSDGINQYLSAIDKLRPRSWRHNDVGANLSRTNFSFKIGAKRWNTALGGTDTLYFLMSYHYGLLALSDKFGCHYPGVSIIDLPGDFLGESVEDKENFIVQPFIDLLAQPNFAQAQVIITGASFRGLQDAHRQELDEVYVV